MVFTAIVVENEYFVLKQLEQSLNSIKEIDLRGSFSNGEDALENLRKEGSVDIIFSDIEMGEHSGLELAKLFLEYADFLVFITGHEQYAMQAYGVGALGYLSKPVTVEDIKAQIKTFAQIGNVALQKKKAQTFIAVFNGTTKVLKMLDLEDVFSMVSNENYINVNTEKGSWLVKNTMKCAEKRFCHRGRFIRISQSVIISIKKIDRVQENRKVILNNGTEFLIARRYLQAFQKALSRTCF